jgi:hypothetical protein
MASGGIDVTPGRVLGNIENITPDKLNDLGLPVLRVQAGAIATRELADGSISADKLDVDLEAQLGVPDGSVTTAKIVNNAVTAAKLDTGIIVQNVYVQRVDYFSVTPTLPLDDTIPQISEGADLGLSCVITPRLSGSAIRLTFNARFMGGTSGTFIAAMFVDSVADAIGADTSNAGGPSASNYGLFNIIVPAHLPGGGPHTYTVRVGTAGGTNTLYFNGDTSTRLLGGVRRITLIAEEISQ